MTLREIEASTIPHKQLKYLPTCCGANGAFKGFDTFVSQLANVRENEKEEGIII